MKVTNQVPLNPQGVDKAKATRDKEMQDISALNSHSGVDKRGGAEVQISDNARFMKQAFDSAKNAPDVRAERVQALKSKIGEGKYRVDSGSIADRLLEDHLQTDFGKNRI